MERTLSVVLPAFNEEKNISSVLDKHVSVLNSLGPKLMDWEILCLNDGSTDRTEEILSVAQKRWSKVKILKHEVNQGIFQSYARLFQSTRGTHVYVTAADGQWPAHNLLKMIEPVFHNDIDLVVGLRLNRKEHYGIVRRAVSFAFNWLPRILLGVPTHDAGSIKLGRRDVFQMNLISRSPFAEAERIVRAVKAGCRIQYVPIDFYKRTSGTPRGANLSNVVRSLTDCFRVFLADRLGYLSVRNTFHAEA